MNPLVMRLEVAGEAATAAGDHNLAALLWEAAAAVALTPEPAAEGRRTGWPPGMLQDDSRELSRALAQKPGARRQADEAAAEIVRRERRAAIAEELRCHLEAIPAFAWARMSEFPTGAACGEWWKVSTVPAVGKLWRGEGREVVDLVRRDAIYSVIGRP